MKKHILLIPLLFIFTSCGTVFHIKERATIHQKIRPKFGDPKRVIRPVAFTLNLIMCTGCLAVDYFSGQMWFPEPDSTKLRNKIRLKQYRFSFLQQRQAHLFSTIFPAACPDVFFFSTKTFYRIKNSTVMVLGRSSSRLLIVLFFFPGNDIICFLVLFLYICCELKR